MNKKKTVLTLLFLFYFFAMHVSANPISEDSARVKAERILSISRLSGGKTSNTGNNHHVICSRRGAPTEQECATYYIFNSQNQPGFAIISGDDCMPAVIGYSLQNKIDVENMPDALRLMLDDYDLYVKYLRKNGKATTRSNVGPLEPGTPIVGPYIQSTWNQGVPYYWLTPVYSKTGNHTPTGCVPTAAAQILNYYKWPQNSFYRVYHWNDMLNSYGSGYSDAEGMAVATLMRDLGAIMGTTYMTGGSSTSPEYTVIPGYICTQTKDLEGGLSKGPLVISIVDQYNGFSHAGITDGYDSNGLYHINWGWGGSCDGYYNLNDMAIVYNEREIHPSITSSYTLLEPDYENDENIAVPAAYGGIETNLQTATKGDVKTITLHDLRLVSGNEFNGFISLVIFKKSEIYGNYYSEKGFYGCVPFVGSNYRTVTPNLSWNNTNEGHDVDLNVTLGELPSNGDYVFVPVYYNKKEKWPEWRMMLQFTDGMLAEDIPFEYQDGNYIFKEVPHGDFNIELSHILTASTYREKGKSSVLAYIKNDGCNNFTGTLTAKFVNANDASDIKAIDYSLFLPANLSNRTVLNKIFNFTGTYFIKDIEIWKSLPTGERQTYLNKSINGTPFTILPYNAQAVTTDFSGYANVQIAYKNNTAYVNDSIYKFEEANVQYYAYSLDADTAAIDIELWAVPMLEGKPYHLKNKTFPLIKNHIHVNTIGGSTGDIPLGDYKLIIFGRCGNNTTILAQPDTIGKGYQNLTDAITDNVIHILNPGIDIPRLKLKNFNQLGNKYYRAYDYVEAQIENVSDVDFQGSDCLKGADLYVSSTSPFRIRSGETATIYPRLCSYDDYTATGEIEEYFRYIINNGVRDLTIPIEGEFRIQFTEKPEKLISTSGIAFYYKNKPKEKPSIGFYSKGILKRSLWKCGEQVVSFTDLQTDSTYSTYKVCPDASELNNISAGNYILKVELTDANGYVWPAVNYPLIIDEEDLPISIEQINFDTNFSMSYDSEIPVIVTLKNPTNQDVLSLVGTEIYKKVDGKESWWADSRELHPVYLPAMQQTTVRLNCNIISQSSNLRSDGTFKVYVSACRTKRGSGHLDFGSGKISESIDFPYISDGISQKTYNSNHLPTAYYTIDGKRVITPPYGLYIVKFSDGTIKKQYRIK